METKQPEPEHLKWIFLNKFNDPTACGMRTWYRDFRADIYFKNGKYEYWLSECFNSDHDVYWTAERYEDNVFETMRLAEIWLREHADSFHQTEYEEEYGLED